MKRENHDTAAAIEAHRQMPQQRVERREFVVHGDAQRLERAADRRLHLALPRPRVGGCDALADASSEIRRRRDRMLLQDAGDAAARAARRRFEQPRELSSLRCASSRDAG